MQILNNNELSILFIGTLVPDTHEFHNQAFSNSGNLVQEGIVDGLLKQGVQVDILSSQPVPSFPRSKILICKRKKVNYKDKSIIKTLPGINVLFIRELMRGLNALFLIITWSIRNKDKKKCVIQYGVYSPPAPILHFACKITKCKYVSVLYDLGLPPKNLKLGLGRNFIYSLVDFFSKIVIPKMDGRIVINENVSNDYAPNQHYLLIDGAVGDNVISKLFDIEYKNVDNDKTIFLCAGALWPINGTRVVLDALKINLNSKIEVWFAGKGVDIELIQEAAKQDQRIKYLGMLNLDKLFLYYKKSDVLMNIRIDEDDSLRYLFPSKFFEYLVTGKCVLTTKVAHLARDYGELCTVLPDWSSSTLSNYMDEISKISKDDLYIRGRKAREYMLKNRTWDVRSIQIKNYIEEYVFS